METIKSFSGEYDFLSNFYRLRFEWDGHSAVSAEHHFQAAKTHIMAEKMAILEAATASKAKAMGRTCTKRRDWEEQKRRIMLLILRAKFRHPVLKRQLLDTKDAHLEEGNTWGDRYWGTVQGVGENHLGKLLMQVREELRILTSRI